MSEVRWHIRNGIAPANVILSSDINIINMKIASDLGTRYGNHLRQVNNDLAAVLG